VVYALDLALENLEPVAGGVVHADHGAQFTQWACTNKILSSGMMPSFASIGDKLDNAMTDSFWLSMQIKLLHRKKWKARVEVAKAMFDYIEIFYNRQRRHPQLGYGTPIEYELTFEH